jgi:ESF2/ABP1 family protein
MAKDVPGPDSPVKLDVSIFRNAEAESSNSIRAFPVRVRPNAGVEQDDDDEDENVAEEGLTDDMDPEGFSGPSKIVKPLTPEALAAFKAAQERAGVIYISRIPPGMRPSKVRHLMSAYGEVGRVYLQQEGVLGYRFQCNDFLNLLTDAKSAYLRRKYTSTKKPHFTEGWVEFKDKTVARSIAEMLNAQPIGGKKGTRWRDDVWTMKYLPKFKWNMLTEQVGEYFMTNRLRSLLIFRIAHEAAIHTARLRVELSQSKSEQRDYLKNVELARVLDKRRKQKGELPEQPKRERKRPTEEADDVRRKKRERTDSSGDKGQLDSVLSSIF